MKIEFKNDQITFKKQLNNLDNFVFEFISILNELEIYISPIELQIAHKLFLSSEKDIEDAEYLYILFRENLKNEILQYFLKELNQEQKFKRDIIGPSKN